MANQLTINGLILDVSPNSRVLLNIEDNRVVSVRELREDEHVASLLTFVDIAESSGFLVTAKETKL